jgi:amino acid transporter
MFLAVIRLRYKYPTVERAFAIPGGKVGVIIVAGMGLLLTCFTIIVGFIPPTQIEVGNVVEYEILLSLGVVITGFVLPLLIANRQRLFNRN